MSSERELNEFGQFSLAKQKLFHLCCLLIHQGGKHQRKKKTTHKLKTTAGTSTNVCQPDTDNFRLEIKRGFPVTGGECFSCDLAGGALEAEEKLGLRGDGCTPGNSCDMVACDSRD